MIYIKAFVGDSFWRKVLTMDITRKRKRTYYIIKQATNF